MSYLNSSAMALIIIISWNFFNKVEIETTTGLIRTCVCTFTRHCRALVTTYTFNLSAMLWNRNRGSLPPYGLLATCTMACVLKSGGYNLDFVDKVPDRFNCQICTKQFRDPHLVVCCGKHFCTSCLTEWSRKEAIEKAIFTAVQMGKSLPTSLIKVSKVKSMSLK